MILVRLQKKAEAIGSYCAVTLMTQGGIDNSPFPKRTKQERLEKGDPDGFSICEGKWIVKGQLSGITQSSIHLKILEERIRPMGVTLIIPLDEIQDIEFYIVP